MADDFDAPKKAGAWGQAVAAVAVVAALGGGLWALQAQETEASSKGEARAATCSDGEPEKEQEKTGKGPRHVSGLQLCEALNRPDLAELLGTPGERAKTAGGSDSSFKTGSGKEIDTPSAKIEYDTYTVNLAATYDGLKVTDSASLLRDSRQQRVLGRPGIVYSDQTISIRFRLDGSDSETGAGVPARVVSVAQDAKDSGGSFELTLWRTDGTMPDDTVLLRVAEKVLPTLPGWAAER
ncbi:DUF6215 domain-containing protein [Streptomyces sp. NPDC051907]|uniref:DUF6215 domain-containing protein n=1 Tax=Streptomyces sp. NPDC051907 TaxID=3155284 RepID=UPI00343795B4